MTPTNEDLCYEVVPGMVRLLVGDLVQLDGGPHLVVRSNFSGATVEPLQKRHVERETCDGKKVAFDVREKAKHICGHLPKHLLLGRGGPEAVEAFKQKGKMNNMITLEPGDDVRYAVREQEVVQRAFLQPLVAV